MQKHCPKCNETTDRRPVPPSGVARGVKVGVCIPCANRRQKAHREGRDNKAKDDANNAKAQAKYKANKRKLINLKGGACESCGLVDTCEQVYDFHHREPELKKFTLTCIRTITQKVIIELFKCDLLCSNCHRRTHASD